MSHPTPEVLTALLAHALADMERRGHRKHRRNNVPLLYAFRSPTLIPGQEAIVAAPVPAKAWRAQDPQGTYLENPVDDLETLGTGLAAAEPPVNAFGMTVTLERTDVVACAMWGRIWTLPKQSVMDEERALRSMKGERVLHDDARRVGGSLLQVHDVYGTQYQVLRRDGDAPEYAATRPVDQWKTLPDQTATRLGFGLAQVTAALASGRLPLP
ncbi:hypothetical protein ACIO3O_36910 [Streptomyces sp. NPDC087440]|uniref:hypothetical protein n=1 Tax=Streptomyces sp. NPDC087440 TaxID=3365790 RepID=UPI0038269F9A